jgi:peptidoglycan/xylan/chitin deacetylase (PgdA/CDA1 family)
VQKRFGAAIGAAGVWTLPAAAVASGTVARLLGMQTQLEDRRGVALTFDDGPHPEGTPAVLDMLARLGIPASFFLTGEQVLRYPELAREIGEQGHTIGVHGHLHRPLPLRTPRASTADLRLAQAVIEDATNTTPGLYRPPYGAANPAVLLAARRAGLRPVLWTRWGRDWERRASAASIAGYATRNLHGGEILLLHDADHYAANGSWRATVTALPEIAAAVARANLSFRAL